jgi:hypothetical protein
VSFPSVSAVPGGKPFETFGKDSELSSEGGSTGRRTDWPCRIKIAWKVKLLRPSVQLPAGIHGCAGYKGFGRDGKEAIWPNSPVDYRRELIVGGSIIPFV